MSVADPGFPIGGGIDHMGGCIDSQGGYVSRSLYVKMKESGPLGGHAPGLPLDLPMHVFTSDYLLIYDFLSAFKLNITT